METAVPQTEVYNLIRNHLASPSADGREKKVLVLGYDGTRVDTLTTIDPANSAITKLSENGYGVISYCGGVNYPRMNTQATSTAPAVFRSKYTSSVTPLLLVVPHHHNSMTISNTPTATNHHNQRGRRGRGGCGTNGGAPIMRISLSLSSFIFLLDDKFQLLQGFTRRLNRVFLVHLVV